MIVRNATQELLRWKESLHRKPLLIRGARQVGKTTLVKDFGSHFRYFIYLNLEVREDLDIFSKERGIQELYQLICLRKGIPQVPQETLLFIDEVQNSSFAIKMLRYFYEEIPTLHVIAAGSMLEAVLSEQHISFPVGRIENLWLYPLSFDEFIGALHIPGLREGMQKIPADKPVIAELSRLYKTYALLGGMPEIVARHIQKPDLVSLNPVYRALLQSYLEDIDKYAYGSSVSEAMRHILLTGFAEAGKRIKLEGFGNSNFKAAIMKEAFQKLERAQLLKLQYPVTSALFPLIPNFRRSPRLQMLDTGLLNFQLGIQEEFFLQPDLNSVYKGIIIQHLVGQELSTVETQTNFRLTFWVREKRQSSAEVDFVLPYKGCLIPIEVKSGKTGTLKSLFEYLKTSNHKLAVRIYDGELSVEEYGSGDKIRLLNLPLCLSRQIYAYLDHFFR